jgi:HlyD family secretion protein
MIFNLLVGEIVRSANGSMLYKFATFVTKHSRSAYGVAILCALIIAPMKYIFNGSGREAARFDAPMTRPDIGDLVVSIASTGRLSARSTINIGSEVSGQISEVFVDFNDKVQRGEIIAQISSERFKAQLRSFQAELTGAISTEKQANRRLRQADRDMKRRRELAQRLLVSKTDLEAYEEQRDQAQSDLQVASASVDRLKASVASAEYDLAKTTIRSPVDGVVLDRMIEPGQTVAASFETPTLLRIAEDLAQMQIELAVDEADIGQVKVGDEVLFTVDAFPARSFRGTVAQIRMAPNILGNSATYPVIVKVSNTDGILIPGMMADALIDVATRHKTLRVPNEYIFEESSSSIESVASVPKDRIVQEALMVNVARLDVSHEQLLAFNKLVNTDLPQVVGSEQAPDELVKFFGAQAKVVVVNDATGDPVIALRNETKRRVQAHYRAFREALNERQIDDWDALVDDIVAGRSASVLVKSENITQPRSVLIGLSDDSFTQILSGVTQDDYLTLSGDK